MLKANILQEENSSQITTKCLDKLYIILPVYQARDTVENFVSLLLKQTHQNYHLILVDDGSYDGTEEMVSNRVSTLTVIKGKGAWFWGGSVYQGIKHLKTKNCEPEDNVLICNNDICFDHYFLENGIKRLNSSKDSMIVASAYSRQTGTFLGAGVHLDWRHLKFNLTDDPAETNCAPTRSIFIKVVHLLKINNIHYKLIPHYLSDYELTMRAYYQGVKLFSDPVLKIELNETSTRNYACREIRLKSYLSKKTPEYIVSWFFFIILLCPFRYIPLNLAKIFYRFIKGMFREVYLMFALRKGEGLS